MIGIEIMREQPDEGAVYAERIVLNTRPARFESDAEHLRDPVAGNLDCHLVLAFGNADLMKARSDLVARRRHSFDGLVVDVNVEVPATRTLHEVDVEARNAVPNLAV